MNRQEAIKHAAKDVADAADFSKVGKTDSFFGGEINTDHIEGAVRSAIERLNKILAKTDAEWAAMWEASEAEERRIEDDACKFAAGKA